MTNESNPVWDSALLAARILAVGRNAIGGIHLRARAGPVRDAWLDYLGSLLSPRTPWRRITPSVPVPRLIGGMDIARSLKAGRPVLEDGILKAADGGILLLSMAERAGSDFVSIIGAAMDNGGVHIERTGFSLFQPTAFVLVCLDESTPDDDPLQPSLADRLALTVDLTAVSWGDSKHLPSAGKNRSLATFASVEVPSEIAEALEGALMASGNTSLRTSLWLKRVCKIIAALDGVECVSPEHAASALQLVRPMGLSQEAEEDEPSEDASDAQDEIDEQDPPNQQDRSDDLEKENGEDDQSLEFDPEALLDMLVAAQQGVLPDLERKHLSKAARINGASASGKSGTHIKGGRHGRPIGIVPTPPTPGARLNVPATLRAAAPWQVLRKKQRKRINNNGRSTIEIRKSDFRYTRLRDQMESTAILSVDASGSTALERLGEAKGAVELLLAECYVRRERVGLVTFRGTKSDVLLAPTRSLVRAKKSLASLVGGGSTPLAAGMMQALDVAVASAGHGQTPLVVLLTDGSANIALDGTPGRSAARHDAELVATQFQIRRVPSIVIDISRRARDTAKTLADRMGADYYALPRADAQSVSGLVSDHMRGR